MALEYPMKASNINIEAARAGTTNAPASGSTSTPSTTSLFGIYAGSGVDQSAPHSYSEFLNKSFVPPVISCGTSTAAIGQGGGIGYFEAELDFSTTTGAIVIYFIAFGVPDGISFLYNGVTYNTLTSNTGGRITAAAGTNNIVGSSTSAGCTESSLIANQPAGGYVLTKSVWNGTGFGSTGNTQSGLIAAATNINLSVSDIIYTLVIPKTAASPSDGTLKIMAPCSGTAWRVTAPCAITLPSFTTNSVAASSTIACCTAAQNQTYYYAKNAAGYSSDNFTIDANTSNLPEVNYFVFSNSTGATALANGYYKINSTQALYVQNGVVDSIVTCPSCVTLTQFNVGNPSAFVADMCSQTAPGGNNYFHDGSTTYPVANDIVYLSNDTSSPVDGGSGIQWPYFANGATLGDSPLAYFRITGSSGTVQSVTNCP